jgi:hypothetical protein
MTPGGSAGKPVREVPGKTPTEPFRIVGPIFVTVDPPRAAKGSGGAEILKKTNCDKTKYRSDEKH